MVVLISFEQLPISLGLEPMVTLLSNTTSTTIPPPPLGYGACSALLTIPVDGLYRRCSHAVSGEWVTLQQQSLISPSRLASYEVFVDFVPDTFFTLLPPAPQPSFAYTEEEDSECVLVVEAGIQEGTSIWFQCQPSEIGYSKLLM